MTSEAELEISVVLCVHVCMCVCVLWLYVLVCARKCGCVCDYLHSSLLPSQCVCLNLCTHMSECVRACMRACGRLTSVLLQSMFNSVVGNSKHPVGVFSGCIYRTNWVLVRQFEVCQSLSLSWRGGKRADVRASISGEGSWRNWVGRAITIAISGKRDEKIMRNVPTRAPYYKFRCFAPHWLLNFVVELESTQRFAVCLCTSACRRVWLPKSGPMTTFQYLLRDFWEKQNKIISRDICNFMSTNSQDPLGIYTKFYNINVIKLFAIKTKNISSEGSTPFVVSRTRGRDKLAFAMYVNVKWLSGTC